MATGSYSPSPAFTVFDDNGAIAPGALINTYAAGTTTPITTYSDSGLTTPNANPVVCDAAGRCTIYLTPGTTYKYVVTTSAAVALWTRDNIGAVPVFQTVTATDLVVTGGAIIGFSGTPVADTAMVGDTLFGLEYNGGNPFLRFDATDSLLYTRASNTLDLVIGGTAVFSADASGVPVLTFDTNDTLTYTRGTNTLEVKIGSTAEATFTASGLAVTNGLIVGFAGTPGDDEIQIGDATFKLDYISNTSVSLLFDTGDYINYDRTANTLNFSVGGNTQIAWVGGVSPSTFTMGTSALPLSLQLANFAGGVGGDIKFRNAADAAYVQGLALTTGNVLLLGAGATELQWGKALVALGGGAAPTLGTIGGSGPATAGQNTWLRFFDSTGAAAWLPVWK